MDGVAWWATVHGVAKSRIRLSDFTLTFHFPALADTTEHSSCSQPVTGLSDILVPSFPAQERSPQLGTTCLGVPHGPGLQSEPPPLSPFVGITPAWRTEGAPCLLLLLPPPSFMVMSPSKSPVHIKPFWCLLLRGHELTCWKAC